jgi:hypothetical protein
LRYRRVRMSPEMIQMLEEQREAFKKKFGREPRPEDPVIYDEDCDEPTPLSEEKIHEVMINALIAAGARSEIVYACRKTGLLVTEANRHLLTRAEWKEWKGAIEEYRRLHPADA